MGSERRTKLIDLTGQRFERLTVIRRMPNIPHVPNSQWLCRCKCKRETVVSSNSLRRKLTRSCGCFADECRLNPKLKFKLHGAARHGKRTPEYISWVAMHQRCSNPKKDGYKYYGARGITVCVRWKVGTASKTSLPMWDPAPKEQRSTARKSTATINPITVSGLHLQNKQTIEE